MQFPETLSKDETFKAQEEYLFIYTSREDIRQFLEETLSEDEFRNDEQWALWSALPIFDVSTGSLQNGVVYKRALGLQFYPLADAEAKAKGHLAIKDKAFYKFARGDSLEGSFSRGDDYRISLNSTYMDHQRLLGQGSLDIPYKIQSFTDTSLKGIVLGFKRLNVDNGQLEGCG